MQHTTHKTTLTSFAQTVFVVLAVAALSLGVARPVHAQDDGGYDFTTQAGGYDFTTQAGGYDFTTQAGGYDFTTQQTGGYDFTTQQTGGYDFTTQQAPGYDFTTTAPSYGGYSGGSYATPSYYGGSYSYSTPNYYGSSSHYPTPSYYPNTPVVTPTIITPVVSPTNVVNDSYNNCVGTNVCNTDNHTVTNTTTTYNTSVPPAVNTQIVYNTPNYYPPTPTYYQPTPTPTYRACTTCNCNSAYCPPHIAYTTPRASVPYVTLSEMPYTGIELGPIGLVMYWSFLVLSCLVMAYLIVVKRAHMKLASSLKNTFFGTSGSHGHSAPTHGHAAHGVAASHSAPAYTQTPDPVDDFVMQQISR